MTPEPNSAEWWDRLCRRYAERGDDRDRPLEHRAIAGVCRGSVLDVGCCFGALADYLLMWDYLGVDVSEFAITEARSRRPSRVFLCGDAIAMTPLLRHCCDTVVAGQFIEHFDDPIKTARLLARLPRRRLILTVPRGPVQNHQRENDGHRYGWADEDAVRKDFGDVQFFDGASHHICWVQATERRE